MAEDVADEHHSHRLSTSNKLKSSQDKELNNPPTNDSTYFADEVQLERLERSNRIHVPTIFRIENIYQ